MADLLNLDALLVDTIPVEKTLSDGTRKHWDLRDDVPTSVGLWRMAVGAMYEQAAKLAADTEPDAGEISALADRIKDRMFFLALSIFQNTDPTITPAQLRAWFSEREIEAIVTAFSTRRSQESSAQGSGGKSATNPTSPTPETTDPSA